jgi:ABC-2 type transport system permease protein
MTLWRLELLRLVRTRRAVALGAVFAFFGFLGPLTARYLGEIIDRFGSGDLTVIVPDPVPADGIEQFASSAFQIGLLVAVVVAAGALALDAIPEMSIFLRTRVRSAARLVVPRYVVTTVAAAAAYLVGVGIAWYETVVLLGAPHVGGMLGGTLLGMLYLAFAVAVAAAVGSRLGGVVGTVGATLLILLALPIVGIADAAGRWLPSHLVGAQVALVRDGRFGDYLGAAGVTLVLIAGLLVAAVRSAERREL